MLDYRISRYCLPDGAETCTVCPLYGEEVGEPVCEDTDPGELFFGVGGDVFSASVFVGQINATVHAGKGNGGDGGNYTGGSPVRAAIDRILYAANEELDPDAAVCALTEKRNARFDPETETGSIVELERRRAAMASMNQPDSVCAGFGPLQLGVNGNFCLIHGAAVEIHGDDGRLHGHPPCGKMAIRGDGYAFL